MPIRFDREIFIDAPDENARYHILQSQLKKIPVSNSGNGKSNPTNSQMRSSYLTFLKSIVLAKLAQMTNGYVAADLMALCREATMVAIEQCMRSHGEVENDTR